MSAVSTAASVSSPNGYMGLALPTLDGKRSNHFCKGSIFLVDEDSRECPSQGAGEIAREDVFLQGFDERRGQVMGPPLQQALRPRMLRYQPFLHRRVEGSNFRERRDSNSFDTYDSESDDDDESITHRAPLRHGKLAQKSNNLNPPTPTVIMGNEATQLKVAVDANSNKRKTPSPVVGEEPAQVSVAPLTEDSMDTEDGTLETPETCDTTDAGYDSDDNMLPSPGRRVSLSPLSRRLSLQFDSISFLSPVKPSRAKRRKTLDTSASSL